MASRAICADCGEHVVATNARPIIRASGIALICGDCAGVPAVGSHPPRPAREVSPLLSAAVPIAPVRPPRTVRAVREPIPEPEREPRLEDDAIDEDDYDAIYVSVEDDLSGEYPAYELDAELPPLPEPRTPAAGSSSDGRDYASTSGAIEVSSGRAPRSDTTPPPAVVIGD